MGLSEDIAAALTDLRAQSLALLDPLDDDDLLRQHSPLMSPLVWDLAHVGNYEDLWLVRSLGAPGVGPQYDDMYDAFRHPRPNRPSLPLLPPAPARQYIAEVRGRALDALERADLSPDGADPLLADGFVYGMVIQHEHQHRETMLATLQLRDAPCDLVGGPAPSTQTGELFIEGGPFVMGAGADPWAYDNERPCHVVDVPAFHIDAAPVTNAAYAEFVDEGGYHRPALWSDEGWKWRQTEGLEAPQFWRPDGTVSRFGRVVPRHPDEPVQHVCFHEAEAYARWAGKRLPTEAEWEKAARHGMEHGQVWEWTASSFGPYPGFRSFPYREYSEVFFGEDYKVLRGGSWATAPVARRPTFRNWDFPIRRQIFSGLRCARDA
jgi:gamma-glutamyl hercynylcysteine S-oxide synthase